MRSKKNLQLILDGDGKFLEIKGSKRVIIERKQIEEALAKQHEELQTILDTVPASIFYKDKENRFLRVNKSFTKMMELPKEELEGKSVFDLYPREQAEAFWKDDKEVITTGKPKTNIIPDDYWCIRIIDQIFKIIMCFTQLLLCFFTFSDVTDITLNGLPSINIINIADEFNINLFSVFCLNW